MTRSPVAEHVDCDVGFLPSDGLPEMIFAVVKRTYDLRHRRLAPAEPLTLPWWEEPAQQRFAPGTDYGLEKPATDVAIVGDAFLGASEGSSASTGYVRVRLGERSVAVSVCGPRVARWTRGMRPRFEQAESVERVPMTWELAYGGGDPRVFVPAPQTMEDELRLVADHPGVYPRNPVGRGYIVVDEPIDEIALPQIEAPDDPLTPERFVTGDPTRWYRQPRPAGLGLRMPNMYPRRLFMGVDAWFPAPDDGQLREVQRGELPLHYRSRHGLGNTDGFDGLDLRFLQESPPELTLLDPPAGFPIEVHGMHPHGRGVSFGVPAAPRVEVSLEGHVTQPPMRASLIVIRPADERATVTWSGVVTTMHRTFIPGIHAEIPLAMRVDGEITVRYRTPDVVTLRG